MESSRDRHRANTVRDYILGSAAGYRAWKVVTRGDRTMGLMAQQYVKPKPGERILDVGCGYGDLAAHLPDVKYVGIDFNEHYIALANRHRTGSDEFLLGDVSDLSATDLGTFDAAVAIGVLHHLTDTDVTSMVRAVSKMLSPSGRFVAAEPVWEPTQRTTARVLAALDRGRFVREQLRYEELVAPWFATVESKIRQDLFWFPYTHCLIEATVQG
jgi:2-polyprenyl-3-methyl-5-hydroxy-6-metoxy-1,4-benzoquinol methylase